MPSTFQQRLGCSRPITHDDAERERAAAAAKSWLLAHLDGVKADR
jgi:hypothetical protein